MPVDIFRQAASCHFITYWQHVPSLTRPIRELLKCKLSIWISSLFKSCEISFAHVKQLPHSFEISLRARQYLCKMAEWFNNWNGYYGRTEIREMWARWRHEMEIFSACLAFCEGNPPVNSEFPSQRPVTRRFYVFFDLRLNKRLSKQSRHRPVIWDSIAHNDVTVM